MSDIAAKYGAYYAAGWVNLDDALFLYWLVRQLKPKTIVQTGVCNGLSSAFMMLGLVKNGPEGKLHVIDLPPVFTPKIPPGQPKERSTESLYRRVNRRGGLFPTPTTTALT